MWTATAGDGSEKLLETEERWTVTNLKIKTSGSREKFKSREMKRSGAVSENPPEAKKWKGFNRERHIFISK